MSIVAASSVHRCDSSIPIQSRLNLTLTRVHLLPLMMPTIDTDTCVCVCVCVFLVRGLWLQQELPKPNGLTAPSAAGCAKPNGTAAWS